MKKTKKAHGSFMHRLATNIVDKRYWIFAVVAVLIVFSIFSMSWVEIENDLTAFLPDKSDSKAGVDIMFEEFTLYGTAQIMVANITPEKASEISRMLGELEGVTLVDYAEDKAHYNNASACYTVNMAYPQSDPRCEETLDEIKAALADYDSYISSDIGNPMGDILDDEIGTMIIVAGIMILLMLLFTSKSVVEVPVILLSFGVAMILNMGTNFIFGKISFVSNSVTSLLQLALSLDYAVILINRFRDESKRLPLREAVIEALTHAVPEVLGSSLTTMGGLAAMACMQFKLGPDMAINLIKSVVFAMLSIFFVMPGVLMLLGPAVMKTQHKSLIPDMSFIGKFAYKTRKVVPPVFLIVIIVAMIVSSACPFAYGYSNLESAKLNEQSLAKKMITDNFGSVNMIALLVPSGDYEKEAALLEELEARDEVASTMGLANTVAMDGYTLADALTPRQFSELAGLDYEMAELVYAAYAASSEDYGSLINDLSTYKVPLIDMFLFVAEQIDTGLISLEGEQAEMLGSAKALMGSAKDMLVGENYSRMVIYLDMPEDDEATFAFIDEMKSIASGYYDGAQVYAVGNATTAKDFKESFVLDNVVVTAVSIITVLLVLLLTFRSVTMPVILIAVIQGAIWISYSIPTLLNTPLFFLGYIIISAIQMGANIDYAIVIATRYNEVKLKMDKRDAIIETMNFAFPTVITSGAIMSITGLLIGNMSSEATIASLGGNLGRGTIISIILVLFVLPQLLLISDKLVDKTSFKLFGKKKKEEERDGRVRVCGRVSGELSGYIEGEIDAIIDGNVKLSLLSGDINEEKEGEEDEK